MDFLKEVGKLIDEETRKAQSSYGEQQEMLKQISEAMTQKQTSSQQPQRTPAQKAAAQRTPVPPPRHQAVKPSAQPKKRETPPPKQKLQPTQTATAKKIESAAPVPPEQPAPGMRTLGKFTKNDVIKGIIISEILGPPPCKRKSGDRF